MSDWIKDAIGETPRDKHRQAVFNMVDTFVKRGYTMQEIIMFISGRYSATGLASLYIVWAGEYFSELEEA